MPENNHKKIFFKIGLFFIICFFAFPSITHAATSVTQYGITWTFDDDYTVGQFVNGDYYVIDPGTGVKIINISPGDAIRAIPVREGATEHMNGSMVNPDSTLQGYDEGTPVGWGTPTYSAVKNVGLSISSETPLIIIGDNSLVSTISNETPFVGHLSYVKDAAVLTVLATAPPAGSFRPGISSTAKILHNKSSINYSLLKKYPIPNGARTYPDPSQPDLITADIITQTANYFDMVFLTHSSDYTSRYMRPSGSGMGNNYYGFHIRAAEAALMLNLDFTDEQKEELLINFIQLGIDLYSYLESGASGWKPDGGHFGSRKWPILFTGLMLDYAPMKNIGQVSGDYLYHDGHGPGNPPADYKYFGEDGQTFYVTQFDVDITNGPTWLPDARTAPNYPYTSAMIGMPEWGIVYISYPEKSDAAWPANYRSIGSNVLAWPGFTMAARMMGAKELWNHDSLFDYVDRYMAVSKGDPDPFGYVVPGEKVDIRSSWLAGQMYDTYRADFDTDVIAPATPNNLSVL